MARPEVSEPAEVLYGFMTPAYSDHDSDANGWAHLRLCEALVQGVVPFWLTAQTNWGAIFDVEACPDAALDYLAQFAGVHLEPDATAADKRAAIADPPGFDRGTVAYLEAVVRRYLTGGKSVLVFERAGGSAYALAVRTRSDETPDPDRVESAILEHAKPAGIVLDYAAVAGQDFITLQSTHTDFADVESDYGSFGEVESDL